MVMEMVNGLPPLCSKEAAFSGHIKPQPQMHVYSVVQLAQQGTC